MRIVSSWRKIKATSFMCGLDALVPRDPDDPCGNLRSQPFLKQVQVAVRRAGGEPTGLAASRDLVPVAREG